MAEEWRHAEWRGQVRRLRRISVRLGLGQAVLGTALTYVHRCRAQWQRAGEVHSVARLQALALACLFLAAKIEENPQRMRDVLNVAYVTDQQGRPLRDSHEYWQLKEQLVRDEQLVLRDMGFDLTAPHVHRVLLTGAYLLNLAPAVVQLASDVANDSFLAPLALRFSDDVIAASAIGIAHAAVCTVAEAGAATPLHAKWWEAIAVSEDVLRQCLSELVPLCNLFDAPPAQLPGLVAGAVEAVCSRGTFRVPSTQGSVVVDACAERCGATSRVQSSHVDVQGPQTCTSAQPPPESSSKPLAKAVHNGAASGSETPLPLPEMRAPLAAEACVDLATASGNL